METTATSISVAAIPVFIGVAACESTALAPISHLRVGVTKTLAPVLFG